MSERMEQLSNILFYAQDYDVRVLEDLHAWLKNLAIGKGRVSGFKSSSVRKAAALIEKLLISKLNSQITYACGGLSRRKQ
jgi:hypothetical protein